jgi:hypothetical protein
MKYEKYNGGLPPDHPLNRGTLVMSLGQGRSESPPPESLEPIEAEVAEKEVTEKDNNPDDSETK